ncbi:MAG: TonB-dependent receptor [Flavobacteriales bacterium]|nr:MAG: TonB-dependent receptor [Flavobacteriales bacterium]
MKYRIIVLLCTFYTFLSFSQEIKKDTSVTKTIKLQEVIIKGNLKTDPTHTTVINQQDKSVIQPKNVADLFLNINGFSVIKRGNYAIDPTFRASQYEQLNIQYDGGTKAVHACPNRMDPITTHILPEEIERIEVIKGPFTVCYGNTFGGIINFVTKKNNLQNGFSGKLSSGYETNGNSFVSMVKLNYASKGFDITGNVGYRNFGNYKDGGSIEIPSSFKSTEYGVKAGYNFSENQRLQFHWRQSFGRDVLHAGLPMDTDFDDSSVATLDYYFKNYDKVLKGLNFKAYYSYVDHLMSNINRPSFARVEATSPVTAITAGGKLEFEIKASDSFTLFTGFDAMHIAKEGNRNRLVKLNMMGNPLPVPKKFKDKIWQDSYITDLGFFAEAKYSLNTSIFLTTGIRYDNIASDIKDPEANFAAMYNLKKRTEHTISGNVSLKKRFSNSFLFEVAYGRGTRPATMTERFINHFSVGQDAYEYVGNPDLKAEVNNQFEIGFKGKQALHNSFDNFSYNASFYYSVFENYITPVVDKTLTRRFMPNMKPIHPKVFRNLENANKIGFEAAVKLDFLKDYYFETTASYVHTKNKDFDESLPLNPPFNSVLKLGLEKEKFWANIQYNITSKQTNIAKTFGESETAGYETIDIRLGLIPFKNATIGLGVLNLTDKKYHNHLNFAFKNQAGFNKTPITEPGINFSIFLQYAF